MLKNYKVKIFIFLPVSLIYPLFTGEAVQLIFDAPPCKHLELESSSLISLKNLQKNVNQ